MNLRIMSLVILALLVSACSGTRISSEIYLIDIDEIPEVDDMTIKIMIGLPITSQDECTEDRREYEGYFRKSSGFKDMEFVRCYKDGYSDLAQFELEVPMRMTDPFASSMQNTFEIVRQDDTESGYRNLYIRSKPSALCNLDRILREETYRSLDLSSTSPKVVITNDLREPQTLILDHVFVNGVPLIKPTEIVMDRRDSVDVVLSDVTAAYIFNKSCNISSRTALVAVWAADSAG